MNPRKPLRFVEFGALIAALMAVPSLSIDNLLPAFEPIRHAIRLGRVSAEPGMPGSW